MTLHPGRMTETSERPFVVGVVMVVMVVREPLHVLPSKNLVTSKNFSGIGNDSSSSAQRRTPGST